MLAEVSTADWTQFWLQLGVSLLAAACSLAVAIMAIYGDWLRSWLVGPIVTIEPHDLTGYPQENSEGRKMVFFFFKVKNTRHWTAAKGVRVLLAKLERRGPDNCFREVTTSIPFQFSWSPSETSQVVQTITDERVFDLGLLWGPDAMGQSEFWPSWYTHPIKQDYFKVRAGEAIRYHLRAVGENFHCKESTVVEVAWDGHYTAELTELRRKHLSIRVVPRAALGPS